MKNAIEKTVPALVSLFLILAVGTFYYLLYPYHLHYYEQMQMFQFSSDYFLETVLLPGGLADYIGRFLTQFFLVPAWGASIMALLFGSFYLSAWLVVGRGLSSVNRIFWTMMLLLPVRFLWFFACDENAMPALWVALIMSLLSSSLLKRVIASERIGGYLQALLLFISFVLLYLLAGPMAFLAAGIGTVMWLRRGGYRQIGLYLFVALAAFTPFMAHHWVNWPVNNLYMGLHYFRFTNIQLATPWVVVGIVLLIEVLAPIAEKRLNGRQDLKGWLVGSSAFVLMSLLIWQGVRKAYRPNNEVAMMYDALVLDERWDDILDEAAQRTPKHPACVQCINLAMAMTGRMGDLLFRCPQPGSDAMLPKFNINFSRPLTAGQIYFNVGWTNTAQRFVYEAQESIPDYEKSARCYKLLAQTHIIRGDKALARKYLKKLQQTLFYADWANEHMRLLADPDPKTLAHHSLYGPLMNGAVRDDYFFGPDVLAMLGNYCTTTPHNRVATQYLLGLSLVMRQLDTFVGCYGLSQYLDAENRIPEYYQQALALDWWQKNGSLDGIPYAIDEPIQTALAQFMADKEAQLPVQQRYMFTYWYYYFSGEKEETGEEIQTSAPN